MVWNINSMKWYYNCRAAPCYTVYMYSQSYITHPYTPLYIYIYPHTPVYTLIPLHPYAHSYTYYIYTPYMQVFGRLLWGMDPFEALEDEDIRTAIANANGTLIHLTHIHTTYTPLLIQTTYTHYLYPYSYTLIHTLIHPYSYRLLRHTTYTPTHTPLYTPLYTPIHTCRYKAVIVCTWDQLWSVG